jgi:hypothetical protein
MGIVHCIDVNLRLTSSMSCGILMGWLAGQLPVLRKLEGPALG